MSYPVNVVEGSVMVWEKNNAVPKELKFRAPRETREFCAKIIIAVTLADDVRMFTTLLGVIVHEHVVSAEKKSFAGYQRAKSNLLSYINQVIVTVPGLDSRHYKL